MSIKMIKFFIVLCGIFLITGCKNKNEDVNAPEPNDVIEDVSEAIETTSDYLSAKSQEAIEAASKTYNDLESDTQSLISDIKNSGEEAMADLSSELDSQLSNAKEKLTNLKEAGEENYKNAEDAFNVAIKELKDAYQKAKTEYEQKEQMDN